MFPLRRSATSGFEQPPIARKCPAGLRAIADMSISYGSTPTAVATVSQYWCSTFTCFKLSVPILSRGRDVGCRVGTADGAATTDVAVTVAVSDADWGVATDK